MTVGTLVSERQAVMFGTSKRGLDRKPS